MNPLLAASEIQSFLDHFPNKSRRRGKHYFADGAVVRVACIEPDRQFLAVVSGSRDYEVAFELYLYFYTLRDVINWAMTQGLRAYSSGPLNYDPKLHLGHELAPLDLYVMHTKPVLNPIFQFAVKYLEPTRHDPVLKKFPNADQL